MEISDSSVSSVAGLRTLFHSHTEAGVRVSANCAVDIKLQFTAYGAYWSQGLVAFREMRWTVNSCHEHNILPCLCVITISQTLPEGMCFEETRELFQARKEGSKPLHPTCITRKQVKCYRVKKSPYDQGMYIFYASPDQKKKKTPVAHSQSCRDIPTFAYSC